MRGGKVLSTLNILTIDLETSTLVISRNNPSPIFYIKNTKSKTLDEPSQPVGVYRSTKPSITELPLQVGLSIVAFTDGLVTAGYRKSTRIDIPKELKDCTERSLSAQETADHLMNLAIDLDDNRPIDDVSIVVMRVVHDKGDLIRRMSVSLPLK